MWLMTGPVAYEYEANSIGRHSSRGANHERRMS